MNREIKWMGAGWPMRLRPCTLDDVDGMVDDSTKLQDASASMVIGDRVRVVGVDGLGDYRLHMEAGQPFFDFIRDCDFWGPTYRVVIGWADVGHIDRLDWVGSADHAHLPACVR